jgi:hypothetical protein
MQICRSILSIIQVDSILYPPTTVDNIFGNWLGEDHRFKILIKMGVFSVIWSLWLCRNDKVFNDKNSSVMHVIYRCTTLFRSWPFLQLVENVNLFMEMSIQLENTARYRFVRHRWHVIFGFVLHHLSPL